MLADGVALGRQIRAVAIEPDTENRRRLCFNLDASRAMAEVTVLDCALGAEEGEVSMSRTSGNRGEIQIGSDATGKRVRLRPLSAALADAGLDHVDCLKIDIEGHETPVLNAFFSESPRSQWPRMILIETRHDAGPDTGAAGLCLAQGYGRAQQMRQNAVFVLPDGDK